uniref:Ubiquitin-like protein ATG12 n=1 Tax=Equus caballus TaxID=9796 RepID=A0A9L0S170_HORSE
MAEEPESALQLSPSTAADGEGPTEVSPETATPEPPSSAAVSPGTEEPAGDTKKKIDILLKAVGDTPIMKTKKWAVERTRTIQGLIDFIKKFLKLVASEQKFTLKCTLISVYLCESVLCPLPRPGSWNPL